MFVVRFSLLLEFFRAADGTRRAAFSGVSHDSIAVDVVFQPGDALRATIAVVSGKPEPARTPRALRWPVALCFFVAMMSATVAFLTSPLASHPLVTPYTTAINQLIDG